MLIGSPIVAGGLAIMYGIVRYLVNDITAYKTNQIKQNEATANLAIANATLTEQTRQSLADFRGTIADNTRAIDELRVVMERQGTRQPASRRRTT
jgi:hypothetical protein